MPGPGIDYPYNNNPRIVNWYHTTIAHNDVTVDERPQDYFGGNEKSKAHADQLIYAPASTLGMQRASTDSVYPDVTMDRAVFMNTHYMADLFGVFGAAPHKYDLAWHIRGEVNSTLKFAPMTFPEPVAVGYNTLTNVRQTSAANNPWNLTLTREAHTARLFAAGADTETQVIRGDSGFYVDTTSKEKDRRPTAPTIIQRRDKNAATLYGNALDFSDGKESYVKSITQEGGLAVGYGLLRVQTIKGTDLCFASYRSGTYKAEGFETDAMQAYVQMNGMNVEAMYLGGGKVLKSGAGSLMRNEPGLAYVEKTASGSYILGNPSSSEATVNITLPALAGMKAFNLNDKEARGGSAGVVKSDGTYSVSLKANSKVELTLQ